MTDLEITKLCAEAMGLETREAFKWPHISCEYYKRDTSDEHGALIAYQPLHDDAQAMALVKRFQMRLQEPEGESDNRWRVTVWNPKHVAQNADLNRAICECVAKMRQANG